MRERILTTEFGVFSAPDEFIIIIVVPPNTRVWEYIVPQIFPQLMNLVSPYSPLVPIIRTLFITSSLELSTALPPIPPKIHPRVSSHAQYSVLHILHNSRSPPPSGSILHQSAR